MNVVEKANTLQYNDNLKKFGKINYEHTYKRILDFLVSIILLLILIIPGIISAIAIKLEKSGTVIYKSKRIGKDGKPFDIYKFRTMGDRERCNSNSRITPVGRILRKTSLDEIPQLLNVIKGDMSLVGPRPWVPDYYRYFTDEQRVRNSVLPGITGLAQVNGRNSIDVLEKIKYDLQYIDNINVVNDFKIMLKTIRTIFKNDNVDITEKGIKDEIEILKHNLKNGDANE